MSNFSLRKPNTTQIPNVIFDHWMPILSPIEFKVLLALCRKTYGWHKDFDRISLRQLMAITGLSKHSIIKPINSLIDHGLILKFQSKTEWGDDAPNTYEVCVFEVETPTENEGGGSARNALGGSARRAHTKETNIQNSPKGERGGAAPEPPAPPEKPIERAKHVSTTIQEDDRLVSKYGRTLTDQAYQVLSEWKQDTPKIRWKKNDCRSVQRWVIEALKEKQNSQKPADRIQKNREILRYLKDKYPHEQALGIRYESDAIIFVGGAADKVCSVLDFDFEEKIATPLRNRQMMPENVIGYL